jgi:CheY-like chemotaxis protein
MQIHSQTMLPCSFPQEYEPEQAPGLVPANFRILIVNEDMRSADSLKQTLRDLGYYSTFTAYSARRALATVADYSPAVALLDLELPDMTGYQLAHKLHSHDSKIVRQVPLLAVAELPRFGNAELACAAGFIGCLAKPVSPQALNALLSALQTGPRS